MDFLIKDACQEWIVLRSSPDSDKMSGFIQSETNSSYVLRFENTFTDRFWSYNYSSSHSNNKW